MLRLFYAFVIVLLPGRNSRFLFTPAAPPHTVDVPLKIPMADEFRQNELIQYRNGTGIKSRPLLKSGQTVFGSTRYATRTEGAIVRENVFIYTTEPWGARERACLPLLTKE